MIDAKGCQETEPLGYTRADPHCGQAFGRIAVRFQPG